jgi:hypothetical protein
MLPDDIKVGYQLTREDVRFLNRLFSGLTEGSLREWRADREADAADAAAKAEFLPLSKAALELGVPVYTLRNHARKLPIFRVNKKLTIPRCAMAEALSVIREQGWHSDRERREREQ